MTLSYLVTQSGHEPARRAKPGSGHHRQSRTRAFAVQALVGAVVGGRACARVRATRPIARQTCHHSTACRFGASPNEPRTDRSERVRKGLMLEHLNPTPQKPSRVV